MVNTLRLISLCREHRYLYSWSVETNCAYINPWELLQLLSWEIKLNPLFAVALCGSRISHTACSHVRKWAALSQGQEREEKACDRRAGSSAPGASTGKCSRPTNIPFSRPASQVNTAEFAHFQIKLHLLRFRLPHTTPDEETQPFLLSAVPSAVPTHQSNKYPCSTRLAAVNHSRCFCDRRDTVL